MEECNTKAMLMEEEIKAKAISLTVFQTKSTKTEAEYKQNLTQLTYDVEHFKNMYEEVKKTVKSKER